MTIYFVLCMIFVDFCFGMAYGGPIVYLMFISKPPTHESMWVCLLHNEWMNHFRLKYDCIHYSFLSSLYWPKYEFVIFAQSKQAVHKMVYIWS